MGVGMKKVAFDGRIPNGISKSLGGKLNHQFCRWHTGSVDVGKDCWLLTVPTQENLICSCDVLCFLV